MQLTIAARRLYHRLGKLSPASSPWTTLGASLEDTCRRNEALSSHQKSVGERWSSAWSQRTVRVADPLTPNTPGGQRRRPCVRCVAEVLETVLSTEFFLVQAPGPPRAEGRERVAHDVANGGGASKRKRTGQDPVVACVRKSNLRKSRSPALNAWNSQ